MLKKLTEEQQAEILEMAICEFGDKGLEKTTISSIAKRSGVSVGVIYKYYANKDDLFQACLDRSIAILRGVLDTAIADQQKLETAMEVLIRSCLGFAREHSAYIRMYNAITVRPETDHAREYAREIESLSAETYTRVIALARDKEVIRQDIDPAAFAFFFDNLLMMLHFSYGCDYYRNRMQVFLGEEKEADMDERIVREMMKFLRGGFGL